MPTYQYACTQCDERLEAVQSFSDAPLTECAVCAGRLRKVFSPVGVVFKGSGFYKTDSRSGAKASSEAASGDKAGSDNGSPKTASDKGSSDKPSADKGSSGTGSGGKGAAPAASTSSTSTPAAKSA